MKTLSIRQPWAWLIVHGIKRIENRTWNTSYRGPLLIHAALKLDDIEDIEQRFQITVPREVTRGAVIGKAELVDVVTKSDDVYFIGPYGFVLTNARRFKRPIPMRGALGLFETEL